MPRCLHHPWLHFFALGGLIFLVVQLWPTSVPERQPVVLTAAYVQALRADLERRLGDAPTRAQVEASIEREVDEEMLFQEALRLGLDRGDSAIRARVIQNAAFVAGDEERSDAELHRQGLALGFDRHDVVIRRILIRKMRLVAQWPRTNELPSEEELARYLTTHADSFEIPERVTLNHVFFSRERRGDALPTDAENVVAELRVRGAGPDDARRYGDSFALGRRHQLRSREQLERVFGPEFGSAIAGLPEGRWSDPIPSAYGLHSVWLDERMAATSPRLDAVRNQISQRILAERSEQRLTDFLEQLRRSYEVRIEGTLL